MKLIKRQYRTEEDYWRMRNFLREVLLLNDCREHSWHVARLDHWRWHYIATCNLCESMQKAATLWETEDGRLAAFVTAVCHDEVVLHVHPQFRTVALENEMIEHAEETYSDAAARGEGKIVYVPYFLDDTLRRDILIQRGYQKGHSWGHHWKFNLDHPIPDVITPTGFVVRSMGDIDEYPVRSWCSWRTYHAEEPDDNYDGDWSWYQNMQSAPLYRRDLDIVATAPDGSIVAFCTISYDDYTRSAVVVLAGTTAECLHRGLGEVVLVEGLHRLQKLGCKLVLAIADEDAEDVVYGAVMQNMEVSETWVRNNF